MNYLILQYYITAAEELHFTRAAAKLFISQQALSAHISKLEKQYDACFFERGTKLRLTYQGERMLEYAKRVVAAERQFRSELSQYNRENKIKLPVGQTSGRGMIFLPSIFEAYHREHPNVIISIVSGSHRDIDEQLHSGRLDLYFGMTEPYTKQPNSTPLYRDKLFFIISRELLSSHIGEAAVDAFTNEHIEGIRVAETIRFPLALPSPSSTLHTAFERYFVSTGLVPNVILETIDHDMMFDTCKNGLCASFVSRELLYRKIMHNSRPRNVLFFPLLDITELATFNMVYSDKSLPQHTIDFMECSRETVARLIAEIDEKLLSLTLTGGI